MLLISDDVFGPITIWQEARGETHQGRVMVGEVIRTRTNLRLFSHGTVASTVLWPSQFSGWNPGDPNLRPSLVLDDGDQAVKDCQQAWFESLTSTFSNGATHYVNLGVAQPAWTRTMRIVATEDHHTFYAS